MQLLELMHTLHTRAGKIFRSWGEENPNSSFDLSNLWETGWCPLLQGIARLCCDARRGVRTTAFNYLSRKIIRNIFNTINLWILWSKVFERSRTIIGAVFVATGGDGFCDTMSPTLVAPPTMTPVTLKRNILELGYINRCKYQRWLKPRCNFYRPVTTPSSVEYYLSPWCTHPDSSVHVPL